MYKNIALSFLAIVAVTHLVFGIVYVTADEFMSYHAGALSTNWAGLDPNYQTLLLALIKLAGAGGIVAGAVNLTLVMYFFKKPYRSLVLLAPFSAVVFQSFTHYVVYQVSANTPGTPPLFLVTMGSCTLLVALPLFLKSALEEYRSSRGAGQ